MSATVKISTSEAMALVSALVDAVGVAAVASALVTVLGIERAKELTEKREAAKVKLTANEVFRLAMAILALLPQSTMREKVSWAYAETRKVIPDATRFAGLLDYVLAKIREYLGGGSAGGGGGAYAPPWDACTKASCWDGNNAEKRMMNILSPAFSQAKYVQYRDWMKSIGCNTAHVFLANKADGENAGYCIYGNDWTWTVNDSFCNLMRTRISDLRAHGFAVVVWLFADDSGAWNKKAATNFPQYLSDLKFNGLLADASTVVAGLELDEYYSSVQAATLISAIRKVYPGKVGTHQTSGKYSFADLADICFYQVKPGASSATIKAEAAKVIKATGKPLNFFELDRHPNRALCDAAFAGGAFGVGNWKG